METEINDIIRRLETIRDTYKIITPGCQDEFLHATSNIMKILDVSVTAIEASLEDKEYNDDALMTEYVNVTRERILRNKLFVPYYYLSNQLDNVTCMETLADIATSI